MKIEIVKKYKVVHTWTGILSSIMLFIAFYAGALAIFKPEITAWTQAGIHVQAGSPDVDALARAFFSEQTAPVDKPMLVLPNREDPTARMLYTAQGERRAAYLDHEGRLHDLAAPAEGKDVGSGRTTGDFVDDVHRAGGLPLDVETAEPIIGIVSLLYAIALVSGVVALLPSLVKDLFLLRITHNVKRMWLDLHNMLGLTSLPFHIVMALTAAVFGLHHLIFDAQDVTIYPQGLKSYEAISAKKSEPAPSAIALQPLQPLQPSQLIAGLKETVPGFTPTAIRYMMPGKEGQTGKARVQGSDDRHFLRAGRFGLATLDLGTGQILDTTYLPGKQTPMAATLSSFFGLHFGNFGGLPVRILYIVLGVLGALVFYSGNLLWIEARVKKSRPGQPLTTQPRHVRWLASLTVGMCLGCVTGLSCGILAVRWFAASSMAPDAVASYAYHGVFIAYVAYAFACEAARATAPLLGFSAIMAALIPLTTLVDSGYSGAYLPAYGLVEVFFTAIACLLFYLTLRARRRYRSGPRIFPAAA